MNKSRGFSKEKLHFQIFVDRYINDLEFREKFDKNRVRAVRSMGFEITPRIKKALEDLDIESLRALGIAMAGYGCC